MSRYNGPVRDRSPPRFSDRRTSATHDHPPTHLGFRGGAEAGQNSNREIPRGPKADTLRHAGPPTPRGRGGFGPRSDFRDREVAPPFRRDNERPDRPRRDREFPVGDRDLLPTRDLRPFHPRDRSMSPDRVRRESKEAPPTALRMSDAPPMWHGSAGRGGPLRARGRADWDRGRGRQFLMERDGFGPRSRSRESWRERDRDWERSDVDHRERFDRRDNERSLERDDREREPAVWRHDRSPSRSSTGNQAPGPSRLATAAPTQPSYTPIAEPGRKFSTTLTPTGSGREARVDGDKSDYSSTNVGIVGTDSNPRRAVSPPSAPTVPAFGSSLEYIKPTKTCPAEASSETAPPLKSAAGSQPEKAIEKFAAPSHGAPFLPPKGPKADRAMVTTAPPYQESNAYNSDLRVKPEIQPHLVRSATSSTPTTQAPSAIGPPRNESWESFAGSGTEGQKFPHKQLSLKQVAPSTSSTLSLKRLDHATTKVLPPKTPPGIPTGPAAMEASPTAPRSNIPTGPRIQPKQYFHPWSAPGYKVPTAPTRPSIMNSAPSKPAQAVQRERNYGLPATHRTNADPFVGQNVKPKVITKSGEKDRSPTLHRRDAETSSERVVPSLEPETSIKDDALPPMSLRPSSDEEADDDDDGLDEEDFADSERKFKKEKDLLAAKRPLSPLRDPIIVGLLVRIQLLGMIADGSAPAGIEADVVMEETEPEKTNGPVGLPSPVAEEEREESPQPACRFLKDLPYNPIPTPPIEDLPFLSTTVQQDQCTFDGSDDDDDERQDSIVAALCQELSLQARETNLQHVKLKEEFSNLYQPWRNAMFKIDQKKREENPLTPAPASPPLPLAPTVVPTPLIERTRGAKNITELDLQNILKASEQSAREEQERRDRELTAKPNHDMEAVIPAMMERHEVESSFFEDRNQLIPEGTTLDVFAFIPPKDDFTAEEQKAFIAAFNNNPKKWSDIAECLPGRDFQQCILHYYLTKHTAKYKDLWRKTLPKKRRGRGPAVRPRSTALMSDLVYEREEVDTTPAAVTDTGRPRRAAAPTFGETATDVETTGVPATATRRVAKESNGEQSNEKSTSRKRAGPKGPKKTKAAAGPAAGPSPQKIEKDVKAARANGKLDAFLPKVDETFICDVQRSILPDVEQARPATLLTTSTLDGTTSGRPLITARIVSQQSSSYWSVPETTYFPTLVDYFGRDWTGISNFMETKTSNMVNLLVARNISQVITDQIQVKNHFAREVLNGKQWLEDRAQAAEERKSRGEPPGFQLDPIPPPKRKYDTTPSSQRLLISGLEPADSKADSVTSKVKAPTVEDFSPPLALRGLSGHDQVPASRFKQTSQPSPISAMLSHLRVDDGSEGLPSTNALLSRPSHGPRAGFFTEERRDVRQAQSQAQHATQAPAASLHGDGNQVNLSQGNPTLLPHYPTSTSAQPIQHVPRQYTSVPHSAPQPPYSQQQTKTQQSEASHLGHLRNTSSTIPASPLQVTLKHEPELSYRRHGSQSEKVSHGQSPARSPIETRFPNLFTMPKEPARPSSTPFQAAVEPSKAAPAKRSNIMSILNDEPSEPPSRKRLIADLGSNMPTYQSPTVTNYTSQSQPQQQIPAQREDFSSFLQGQQTRSPFPQHSSHMHIQPNTIPPSNLPQHQDPTPNHSVGPPAGGPTPSAQLGREWIQRFDPRQSSSSTGSDHSAKAQQPSTISPYATAPSSLASQARDQMQHQQHQPSSVPSYQYRTPMQQQQLPLHAPSPPLAASIPMQQPYHRTHSTSSQGNHSRMPSYNNSQQHGMHVQTTPVPPPPQPPAAPHSSIPRPPSVGYDGRSLTADPQQQHQTQSGYAYALPQQQQQQQWMEDSQSMLRQLQQRQQQRYELLLQLELQQQHSHQSRGSVGHQHSTAPPSRTYTPAGGLMAPAPSYTAHPQQQQQSHTRHYSQSGGNALDEMR